MLSKCKIFLCVSGAAILATALGVGISIATHHHNSSSPQSSSSTGSSASGTGFKGDITFYAPGLGSCGTYSTPADAICAISHSRYDAAATANGIANPNLNPLCGKQIRVTRGGKSVLVTVVDRCEGCAEDDVDLSPSAFEKIAEEKEGRVKGSWDWVS